MVLPSALWEEETFIDHVIDTHMRARSGKTNTHLATKATHAWQSTAEISSVLLSRPRVLPPRAARSSEHSHQGKCGPSPVAPPCPDQGHGQDSDLVCQYHRIKSVGGITQLFESSWVTVQICAAELYITNAVSKHFELSFPFKQDPSARLDYIASMPTVIPYRFLANHKMRVCLKKMFKSLTFNGL